MTFVLASSSNAGVASGNESHDRPPLLGGHSGRHGLVSRHLLLAAPAGVAAGIVAKVADGFTDWAASMGTYPAVWVLAIAVIARFAASLFGAAVASIAFFVGVLIGYYGYAVVVLGFGWPVSVIVMWLAAAVTLCPVLAAGLAYSRRHRGPVAAAIVGSALGIMAGTNEQLRPDRLGALLDGSIGVSPVQLAMEVLVAVAVVAWFAKSKTLPWFALIALPVILVVPRIVHVGLSVLYQLFG